MDWANRVIIQYQVLVLDLFQYRHSQHHLALTLHKVPEPRIILKISLELGIRGILTVFVVCHFGLEVIDHSLLDLVVFLEICYETVLLFFLLRFANQLLCDYGLKNRGVLLHRYPILPHAAQALALIVLLAFDYFVYVFLYVILLSVLGCLHFLVFH